MNKEMSWAFLGSLFFDMIEFVPWKKNLGKKMMLEGVMDFFVELMPWMIFYLCSCVMQAG